MLIKNKLAFIFLILLSLFLFLMCISIIINKNFRQNWVKIIDPLILSYHRLSNAPLCKNCNVILVSIDTLSANHLPCYGYGRNTSPNLCSFARENVIFSNTFSNATFTLPSHTTMFTGLIPSVHQVNKVNADKLSPKMPFLPEILKNNGYNTYFYMPKSNPYLPIKEVYNRGIDNITNTESGANGGLKLWKEGLKKLGVNNAQGKKTFLFLHTYHVHAPYTIGNNPPLYTNKKFDNIPVVYNGNVCSPKFADYFIKELKKGIDTNFYGNKTNIMKNVYARANTNRSNFRLVCQISDEPIVVNSGSFKHGFYIYNINKDDPEQIKYIRDLYDQRIKQLDQLLIEILRTIKYSDFSKNTVVVITADHGEEFKEHGYIEHNTLYDSNISVPLIMRVPGLVYKDIKQLAQTADITPTILDLLGIQNNYELQGKSLVNSFFGITSNTKKVVSEKIDAKRKTIRNNQFKLFVKEDNNKLIPYELYDTINDPDEKNNIIFSRPDIADSLFNDLNKILK